MIDKLVYANPEIVVMLKNKNLVCIEHGKEIHSLWQIIKCKIECTTS